MLAHLQKQAGLERPVYYVLEVVEQKTRPGKAGLLRFIRICEIKTGLEGPVYWVRGLVRKVGTTLPTIGPMSGLIVCLFDYYVEKLVFDEDGFLYLLTLRVCLYFLMGQGLFLEIRFRYVHSHGE